MFSLLLTGDVMLGRGIDQILPHPCDPTLNDPRGRTAVDFVHAAEELNGPIPRGVDPAYVWGDALAALDEAAPDLRIVNLETAVTTVAAPAPKPVTFRMNPRNIEALRALKPDCCVLANNHVLDWGEDGLVETLETLDRCGLARAGAGWDENEAWSPRSLPRPDGGRVIVISMADVSCGAPLSWAARAGKPGIAMVERSIDHCVAKAAAALSPIRTERDFVVASIHWGENWGYGVGTGQFELACRLIDEAGVDVVHGHSAHHPRQMALHNGRLIMFGCGDLINDYEGLRRMEALRPELVAAYLLTISGARISKVSILPFRVRRFRLECATAADGAWLADSVSRASTLFRTAWIPDTGGRLMLARVP
jgi:poly-gamma-glutamate synthesis protein (capsule biosynthesis protein)